MNASIWSRLSEDVFILSHEPDIQPLQRQLFCSQTLLWPLFLYRHRGSSRSSFLMLNFHYSNNLLRTQTVTFNSREPGTDTSRLLNRLVSTQLLSLPMPVMKRNSLSTPSMRAITQPRPKALPLPSLKVLSRAQPVMWFDKLVSKTNTT